MGAGHLRTSTEKLILYETPGDGPEYYDLAVDPAERYNRAADPSCAAAVAGMDRLLEAEKGRLNFTQPDLRQDYSSYGKR